MRMLQVAKHEFHYMFFSMPTLIAFLLLFGFAALFTGNGVEFQLTTSGGKILINAPIMITLFSLLTGMAAIFFVPSYMANAVLKDVSSKFDSILFSTPLTKNDYLFGRFSGAFATLMLVMAAAPLGMLLGTLWPWAVPETLGPTNISHYVAVYFGFLMPSMFLTSTLVFAVAVLSRSMIYSYITVLGLFIFYIAGQGFVNAGGETSSAMSALWDPFMLGTVQDEIRYWTTTELNKNLISYSGTILLNRLVWLGIAIGFFIIAYVRFSFRAPTKLPKEKTKHNQKDKANKASVEIGYHGTPQRSSYVNFQQFLFATKFEISAVLRSLPFLLLMGFSFFLLSANLSDQNFNYGIETVPVTRILISGITSTLPFILFAIAVFFGADIVWRDRENKFSELIDATATPNWVFVASKLVALAAVVYAILLMGVAIAVVVQISKGYSNFEFGFYLERMFLFSTSFIFLMILSCFLQVLVKSRFLGIMMMGLFWVVSFASLGIIGVEHPLLKYAIGTITAPLSDMNGTGRFIEAELWVRTYNASIAGILIMLTYVLWNRGTLQPLKYRLSKLRAFKSTRYLAPFASLLILFIGSGSFIYYNTNILNTYRTRAEMQELRVQYEQKYGKYANLPLPQVTSVKIDVDIFPDEARIETRGTNIIENKTTEAISTVHITYYPRMAGKPKTMLEGATLVTADEEFKHYIFELDTPMQPGEKRTLTFETLIESVGFPHRSPDVRIIRNGTFTEKKHITPLIGFNTDLIVTDSDDRRDAGLPPRSKATKLEDINDLNIRNNAGFIDFETTISTKLDQTALSSGTLKNEWVENGRRYFHYEADQPILNIYGFLSAKYEVLRDQVANVDLEIFYHKAHEYNIDRLMNSAKDSLSYYTKSFGPYQFNQLRIVEFPAYRPVAKSFPDTIAYSSKLGFLADIRDGKDIDVPYYMTAHEVAHQWWPHQVTPAAGEGAGMLSESLPQYSALMAFEQKYGEHQVQKFLKYELDSYLAGRNSDPDAEVPLIRAEAIDTHQYIMYRKGALVLYALKDYLGEDVMNRALKRLVQEGAVNTSQLTVSSRLLAYLKEEAGPAYHSLIEDLLEKVTLYDVKLTDSSVEELTDGRFKVSLTVEAQKLYSDGTGNQTAAAFDIPVDIGVFLNDPDAETFTEADVLFLEKQQIIDGKATIEIIVDKRPTIAGIDPYNKLIDRDTDDNLMQLN